MSRELPPLNALRAFEATARLGSVNRAAQELHVTHGAISRQLRALEDACEQPLFVRQGRGVTLSPAGEAFYERIASLFEQLRDGWSELRRQRSQAPFVLSCPSSLLARWVIPRLERLEQELPDLHLHLSPEEDPLNPHAQADAALALSGLHTPTGWQVHTLAPERIGAVISPRHTEAARLQHRPPAQLLQETLLHTSSRPQAWPVWAQAHGLDPAQLRYGQGFTRLYYMLEAAVAGLGVAIAPEPLVQDDLAAGRLIAPWGFIQTDAHWMLATPQPRSDARIAALAAWLRKELA